MPDQASVKYAAQITISLPGEGRSVTLTVTLGPADMLTVDGVVKPLAECTLADLEHYAQELEADVWDTYESILLPELDADKGIEVEVKLLGDVVELPINWQQLNLLLPVEALPQTASPGEDGEQQSEEEASELVGESQDAPEAREAERDEEPGDEEIADLADQDLDAPAVAVAQEEPVYPEIEETIGDEVPAPDIVDSQARVRVAGKRLPLHHATWAAADILIDEPALRAAQAHALSSLNREVAGVLIGRRPEKQPDGRYVVHIFDTIIARHTVMQGASVTYTPESWRYLNDTLAERYPDDSAVMVGWYHTHPGFGVFLSGMDLFIHQNFFTQIWHVALVLDPVARTSGFFCWDRQKGRVSRYDFGWPAWAKGSW